MTLALHGKSAKRQAVLVVGALLAILIGALAATATFSRPAAADVALPDTATVQFVQGGGTYRYVLTAVSHTQNSPADGQTTYVYTLAVEEFDDGEWVELSGATAEDLLSHWIAADVCGAPGSVVSLTPNFDSYGLDGSTGRTGYKLESGSLFTTYTLVMNGVFGLIEDGFTAYFKQGSGDYGPISVAGPDCIEAPDLATVTIKKVVESDPVDTSTSFPFDTNIEDGNLDGEQDFALVHNATTVFNDVAPGTYSFNELVPDGWIKDRVVCTAGQQGNTIAHLVLTVEAGDDITCTFYNQTETPDRAKVIKTWTDTEGTALVPQLTPAGFAITIDFAGPDAPAQLVCSYDNGLLPDDCEFDVPDGVTFTVTESGLPANASHVEGQGTYNSECSPADIVAIAQVLEPCVVEVINQVREEPDPNRANVIKEWTNVNGQDTSPDGFLITITPSWGAPFTCAYDGGTLPLPDGCVFDVPEDGTFEVTESGLPANSFNVSGLGTYDEFCTEVDEAIAEQVEAQDPCVVTVVNEFGEVAGDGQICIEKYSDENGDGLINGTDALLDWNGTISGPGLTGDVAWSALASTDEECQNRIAGLIVGETYTITEDTVAGWTATNATVNDATQGNVTTVQAVATNLTAPVVTVRFHNEPDVDETPTPTNTPVNTPTPTNTPVNTPTATPTTPGETPTSTPTTPANTPTNTPVAPTATPTDEPTEVPTEVPTPTSTIVEDVAGEITPGPGLSGTPIAPASGSGNAVAVGPASMTMVLLAMLFITSGGLALVAARKRN